MRRLHFLPSLLLSLVLIFCGQYPAFPAKPKAILIVTGGKTFEREPFFEMFSSFGDVVYDTASKPDVFTVFGSDDITRYDAIVFYDTYQPITAAEQAAFLTLFDRGIGCVFLHHALVSHQEWEEYETILGGRYHHSPYLDEGKKYGPSTYKHDQDFTVRIVDPGHPITRGMSDFPLHDETYLNFKVHDRVHPLLASDTCEEGNTIGWTTTHANSRIVYLQPGHDHHAFENPNYRRLVRNAIEWVAER